MQDMVLKSCPDAIVPVLTQIANLFIQFGHFPQLLKAGHVRPLLKKLHLDPKEFFNYRPVSKLPILAEVIENACCCGTPKSSSREA